MFLEPDLVWFVVNQLSRAYWLDLENETSKAKSHHPHTYLQTQPCKQTIFTNTCSTQSECINEYMKLI